METHTTHTINLYNSSDVIQRAHTFILSNLHGKNTAVQIGNSDNTDKLFEQIISRSSGKLPTYSKKYSFREAHNYELFTLKETKIKNIIFAREVCIDFSKMYCILDMMISDIRAYSGGTSNLNLFFESGISEFNELIKYCNSKENGSIVISRLNTDNCYLYSFSEDLVYLEVLETKKFYYLKEDVYVYSAHDINGDIVEMATKEDINIEIIKQNVVEPTIDDNSEDISKTYHSYGVITPEGIFYPCDYSKHNELYYDLKDKGIVIDKKQDNPSEFYEREGWLKLTGSMFSDCEFIFSNYYSENFQRPAKEGEKSYIKIGDVYMIDDQISHKRFLTKQQIQAMIDYKIGKGETEINFNFNKYTLPEFLTKTESGDLF